MRAVILAAGRGTRIEPVTNGLPKCLLTFGDRTILDYQITGLWAAGVSEIGIVTGHNASRIVEHISNTYSQCLDSFHFMHNQEFVTTNNIYSLWLARGWVERCDFLCLNADVLCHPDILLPVMTMPSPISMIVDPEWRDESMKVIVRAGGVALMGKAIPPDEFSATYIGITAFSREITASLFREIGIMVAEGRVNDFFNAAVQRLIERGLHVGFTTTGGLPWAEIDDVADLRFARNSVHPRPPADVCQLRPEPAMDGMPLAY